MKKIILAVLIIGASLFVSLNLHAQSTAPDSIVQATLGNLGEPLVAREELPLVGGTYFLICSNASVLPMPCAPWDASLPVFALSDSKFIVDGTRGMAQVNLHREGYNTVDGVLAAQANAVENLVSQNEATQMHSMMRGMSMDSPGFQTDSTGASGFSNDAENYTWDTNQLWLEITNVTPAATFANLHNATNQVYAIWSATNIATPLNQWQVAAELWPGNIHCQPFNVPNFGGQNFYLRAEDWTGIDSNGDGVPDWWIWQYYGNLSPTATNSDIYGFSLGWAYTHNYGPTVLWFGGIQVTNQYVATTSVPLHLDIQGTPWRVAVLVDDTNVADAVWSNYVSPDFSASVGLVEGWHQIKAGLYSHTENPAGAVWRSQWVKLDFTPPPIIVTSLTSGTVADAWLQVAGYSPESLQKITCDINNAAGTQTNQPIYLINRIYDVVHQAFTTNFFQAYDLPLAVGANVITLRATDMSGNVGTTSFTVNRILPGSGGGSGGSNSLPPLALNVVWPPDGAVIAGDYFLVEAQLNSSAAAVTARVVDGSGNTNQASGTINRDGTVWLENLPLAAGDNAVTVTATDAAGNNTVTNLTVSRSSATVTMAPLTGDQLKQASVTVHGTVSDATLQVYVNGVQASVYGDGTWEAGGVPAALTGTAVFNLAIYPPEDAGGGGGGGGGGTSVSSVIGTRFFSNQLNQPNTSQPTAAALGIQEAKATQEPSVQLVDYQVNDNTLSRQNFYDVRGNYDHTTTYTTSTELAWTAGVGGGWTYLVDADKYSNPMPADVGGAEAETVYPMSLEHGVVGGTVWQSGTVDSHTALYTGGEYEPGRMNLFLMKVWVQNAVPAQVTVPGWTLTPDMADTNWGDFIVSVPDQATLPVTPQTAAAPHYYYGFQLAQLDLQPAVDANRDGDLTFDQPEQDNPDQTSSTNYCRFWVNNDHDGYDSGIADYDDMDPSVYGSDTDNTSISCTRDLEDYTRLWINTKGITTELQNGTFLLGLEWKDVAGSPGIRIFPAVETNGGTLYLTDGTTALAQSNAPYGNCIIDSYVGQDKVAGNLPFIIPTNFWTNANVSVDQPVVHLLFDAVSRGSGQLVVSIYKNDKVTKLAECQQPLYLKLQDVKEMYDRYTVGDGNGGAVATTASLAAGYSHDSTITAENNYILFVHGWNLAPWEKDAFAQTAFKRLYWQGYKGHFGAFQWPTGYGVSGIISAITDARNYDNSESNAWASATGLLGKLTDLNSAYSGHVYLMAHSMGNVVAGEALKLAGSSQVVNTYVAMQGAVPAHCYDASTVNRVTRTQPDYYAHYWTDVAPCYFNDTVGAGTCVNFFNASDWALNYWCIDQDFKPDSGYFYGTINGITGFFSGFGSGGPYPFLSPLVDRYTIFAYADPSWSYALGAQADVGGVFSSSQLDLDATYSFGSLHKGHSAEFNSDNMQRASFWNTTLIKLKLKQP